MDGVLQAELLKLRKRPAAWVIGSLVLYFSLFQYYIVEYITYRLAMADVIVPNLPPQMQLDQMSPALFLENVMEAMWYYGTMLAIILGALVAGNEYGWGTLKTILTQRPSRSAVYVGQVLAVAVIAALIVLATFGAVSGASWLIARAEGEDVMWPPLTDIAGAAGGAWLLLILWAAMGMLLATRFRSAAVAIGVGIAWVELIEGSIIYLFSLQFDWLDAIQEWLPWANASTLAAKWGLPGVTAGTPVASPVSGQQFLWVTVGYLGVAVVLGVLLFRRRDVT